MCGIKLSNIHMFSHLVKAMSQLVTERKPDVVVPMGDLLDGHELVQVQCLVQLHTLLDQLSSMTENVVILVGNHDYINHMQFMTNNHPYNGYKSMPNITVADKVLELKATFNQPKVDIEWVKIGKKEEKEEEEDHASCSESSIYLTMCPYVPCGRVGEALDSATNLWREQADRRIIFGHQEIEGVNMGCVKSIKGDRWSEGWPHLISGHIHQWQRLRRNVLYIGTPFQTTYGCEDAVKMVSLLTICKSKGDVQGGTHTTRWRGVQGKEDSQDRSFEVGCDSTRSHHRLEAGDRGRHHTATGEHQS